MIPSLFKEIMLNLFVLFLIVLASAGLATAIMLLHSTSYAFLIPFMIVGSLYLAWYIFIRNN